MGVIVHTLLFRFVSKTGSYIAQIGQNLLHGQGSPCELLILLLSAPKCRAWALAITWPHALLRLLLIPHLTLLSSSSPRSPIISQAFSVSLLISLCCCSAQTLKMTQVLSKAPVWLRKVFKMVTVLSKGNCHQYSFIYIHHTGLLSTQ